MKFKLTYFGDGIEKTRYHTRKEKQKQIITWNDQTDSLVYVFAILMNVAENLWDHRDISANVFMIIIIIIIIDVVSVWLSFFSWPKRGKEKSHLLASLLEGSFESKETNFSLSLSLSLSLQTHIPTMRGERTRFDHDHYFLFDLLWFYSISLLFSICLTDWLGLMSFSCKYSSCFCPNQHQDMSSGVLHTSQDLSNRNVILVRCSPLIRLAISAVMRNYYHVYYWF